MRISYIDKLKGLAILFVVIGHITEKSLGISNSIFNTFYGSFNNALFMFLSGMFALRHVDHINMHAFCKFVKKKFLRLMMPFLVGGGSYTILKYGNLFDNLDGFNGYWFLLALFYCMLILWLINAITYKLNNRGIKYAIGVGMWLLLAGLYYLNMGRWIPYYLNFIKMFPFFTIGALYDRHKEIFERTSVFTLSIIGYIACLLLHDNIPLNMNFAGFFACIILVKIFGIYEERIPILFSILGENSIEIYVFHWFFLPVIFGLEIVATMKNNSTLFNGNFTLLLLFSGIIALGIAGICILLSKVFKQSRLFNFLIFGYMQK